MRPLASSTLTIALLLAACGADETVPKTQSEELAAIGYPGAPPPTPSPTHRLTPFFDRNIKIAFVGGSITEGADKAGFNNWAYRTTQYFLNEFRTVAVEDYALGGSGSQLATYRLADELGDFKPDFAFIEFAVNDASETREEIWSYTDAIVDTFRRANPDVLIIYVATSQKRDEAVRRSGGVEDSVRFATEISERNNVLFIDAGSALWDKVIAGEVTLEEALPDGIHPSAAGHRIYAEFVTEKLEAHFSREPEPVQSRSTFIGDTRLDTARLLPSTAASGCQLEAQVGNDIYLSNALVCDVGDIVELRFTGTTLGILQGTNLDAGNLDCTLDGVPQSSLPFYLPIASALPRRFDRIIYSGLANDEHILRCTVVASPDDPNRDRVIIGRWLVSSGTLLDLSGL